MTQIRPVQHDNAYAANPAPVAPARTHDETHAHVVRSASPAAAVQSRADMHPAVYKIALACWLFFLGLFWVTFAVSGNALFMVAVSTFYAAVFFSIPYIFSRIASVPSHSNLALKTFMRGRFETIDGPMGGGEALLQVIMVPLLLSLGGIAMFFIIHGARAANGF